MTKTQKGIAAALAGQGIFGFSFLFSKLALEITTPSVLLALRFILAFAVLNIILLVSKQKLSLRGKPIAKLLLMGLLQPVVYFITEAYGIANTSSSFSGIMIGLSPVVGLVLGAIFLKEKCTVVQVIWTLLSVVGVALTTSGGMGRFSPFGFICLLIAVFSAAMYTIISRDISESFSPFERTYVMFLMGASVFTVMAGFENRSDLSALVRPLGEPIFWAALIYLAVLSSVCAFMLLNYSVNHIEAGHSLIFANFNTVISVLAGIFIMGEQFMPLQLVGIVMIVFSVFGVSAAKKRVM